MTYFRFYYISLKKESHEAKHDIKILVLFKVISLLSL